MTGEERLWLWLNYATEHNAGLFYELLEQFGDLEEAYDAVKNNDTEMLRELDPAVRSRLSMAADERFLNRYTGWMEKNGVRIVTPASENYPVLLGKTDNPASVLFYRGTVCSDLKLPVGIGTFKDATDYGKETARVLGRQIAENGGTVVAGIDGGIGSAALQGALECVLSKTPAYGILPCGIDRVPEDDAGLCAEIAERGCLLTEYIPKAEPEAGAEAAINRLAKHLSRCLIVIEADPKAKDSGWKELCSESGLYAVPGRIGDPKSRIPNRMIQNGNAAMLLGVKDILSDFSDYIETAEDNSTVKKRTVSFLRLNDLAQRIYMALRQGDKSAEELSDWIDATSDEIEEMLRKMKNAEIVRNTGHGMYTIDQSTTVVTFGE